jgi:uncharacterized phage protein (TIGR02218 family)
MKTLSANYRSHVAQQNTTLAVCWRLVKTNGDTILGTNHDRDIVISATSIGFDLGSPPFDLTGVYKAGAGIVASSIKGSSDMSVDNMEVDGALSHIQPTPDMFIDVSIPDIKAGLYDGAGVTTFMVNWQDPDDFQDVLRHGFFGQINWDSDGRYKTEIRGLMQVLQQNIGRTCGENCDVEEFGDARCKLDLTNHTVTGVVVSVTSNKQFVTDLSLNSPAQGQGDFNTGKLTWTTGENAGFVGQVKDDSLESALGSLVMVEEFPFDVEPGDEFVLIEGCNRRETRCKALGNFVNYRGPGILMPGMDEIIRAP